MKKTLLLTSLTISAFVFTSAAVVAAPFINQASSTVSKPTEVKRGGSFADGSFGSFETFNPLYSRVSGDIPRRLGAYTGLFTLDAEKREYVPYLAESYTLSPDKRVWTFKLRPEAKWSDGKPLIADDFVLSTKINQDEDMESQYYDEFFQNDKPVITQKVDDRTVRVTFAKATVDTIESLPFPLPAHVFAPAYAKGKKALQDLWNLKTDPASVVTLGPWVLRSFREGERIVFVKSPTFGEWNKDSAGGALPYIDGYTVELFKDGNAEFAAFLSGKLDSFTPRNANDLAQIKAAVDGGNLKAVLRPNISSGQTGDRIAWNWNRASDPRKQKLFRDPVFRRAMSHLMNRSAMVQLALNGTGSPMYDYVPPLFKLFQSPNLAKFDYDPEQASKLLSQIGFRKKNADGILIDSAGKTLEFDLSPNAGNNRRAALSQIFADEAKKIGVKVNVRPVDTGTWSAYLGGGDKSNDRKFDAVMYGITGGGVILPFSAAVLDCRTGSLVAYNQSGKCIQPWETTVNNLFAKSQLEFDNKKRQQLVFQIQDTISREQPIVYLVSPNYHAAWSSKLKGEYPSSIADAYIEERDITLVWINQ